MGPSHPRENDLLLVAAFMVMLGIVFTLRAPLSFGDFGGQTPVMLAVPGRR